MVERDDKKKNKEIIAETTAEITSELRTLKDIINTPFKKTMFAVQILSYVLIVGSPVIGGAIGGLIGIKATKTGGLILGIFLAGEVMFYGSLAFLGKEVVLLIRDKIKVWFRKRKVSNRPGRRNRNS